MIGERGVSATRQPHYQPRVLLAEDDECTLRVVQKLLQKCGYEVTVARDGRQALDILRSPDRPHIDLVDGLDLVAEVMSSKCVPSVPVIVMSAQACQDVICKALQAGAVDCLEKPIRHSEVVTMWQHVWKSSYRPQGTQMKRSRVQMDPIAPGASTGGAKAASDDTSQEDGSGCEGHSSCTVLAPAAKRIRRAHGAATELQPGKSMCSYGSSTLYMDADRFDVGGGSERHLLSSGAASDAEMADGGDESGKPQLAAVRPHEAPVFSSASIQHSFPRILSAPSVLSTEAPPCSLSNLGLGKGQTSTFAYASSSEEAVHEGHAVTEDDSDNSATTAERPVDIATDTCPFAAFSKLSGCEAAGAGSSVHLEIAPLDLAPWPSTQSSMGRLPSMALQFSAFQEQGKDQVEAAAASLRMLAKAIAAATPRPDSRSSPPLLQPLRACQGSPAVWAANRKATLEKLRKKKKLRSFHKKVRYESRRRLAESRPRVRGQFVKAAASGP